MTETEHFQMMARYSRIANERLYRVCAELDDNAYRAERHGSFGSIHKLLNHMLLGDRIWMARFEGGGRKTPSLGAVLYDRFPDLRVAREQEDVRIENFFNALESAFFDGAITYTNSRGIDYAETIPVAVLHFFNHQTHHRGQVHVMLSDAGLQPPSLDMHRILNP